MEEDNMCLWGTLIEIEDHGGSEYKMITFDTVEEVMKQIDRLPEEGFLTIRGILGQVTRIRKDVIKVTELERVSIVDSETETAPVKAATKKKVPSLTQRKVDKPAT